MITPVTKAPYRKVSVVPTGFDTLDKIIGVGGIPLRRITEISGPPSAGKSSIAMSLVANAQKAGLKVLYADTESWFDEEVEKYAEKIGIDLNKLQLAIGRHGEEILDDIEEWVAKHKDGIVILDSVGGLLPKQEAEKDAEGRTVGGQAKMVSVFCRKIVPLLAMNNIGLVALNHEFVQIMQMGGGRPPVKTSGGAKLEYHKVLWIRLTKTGDYIRVGENTIGEYIKAEIRKNKLSGTVKQSAELRLEYGVGFSKSADLVQQALDNTIIKKSGNTYTLKGKKLAIGVGKLYKTINDSYELQEALKAEILALNTSSTP